jgi:hypothetical protein
MRRTWITRRYGCWRLEGGTNWRANRGQVASVLVIGYETSHRWSLVYLICEYLTTSRVLRHSVKLPTLPQDTSIAESAWIQNSWRHAGYERRPTRTCILKELNPRRRVYVEVPKPSKVELKCSQNAEGFWRNFSGTREGFGIISVNIDPTPRV